MIALSLGFNVYFKGVFFFFFFQDKKAEQTDPEPAGLLAGRV
jgi:hypothetical protein